MVKYIKRNLYLNKIKPYINKELIKVFTGQRRVGKSYLMYQVMDQIKEMDPECNIIYIDKERNEFDQIRDYNDLIRYINENSGKGKNAIFIDEIQDITEFERALRSFYKEPGFDIYCTGSNAKILSGDLASSLSGRYIEIRVYSLSYQEFLDFHKLENNNNALTSYMRFGGLPNLIHLKMEKDIIYDYLDNIYASILYKDVIRRYSIRNVSFLENLVSFLADNTGSIVSAKKISDFLKSQNLKISPNAVIDYLKYLTDSYFIYKSRRQDLQGKKIFTIGEKYYFEDIGLRNSISGFKVTDTGKIIENIVYNHLKINGYTIHTGVSGSTEVDFIAEKKSEKIYVQACYLLQEQKTIDREFGNLLAIKDNYPKMVVSMDELSSLNTFKGIHHLNLREFLSGQSALKG